MFGMLVMSWLYFTDWMDDILGDCLMARLI